MGFGDAIRTVLKEKYATFSGRASRSEYWWFQLFYWLAFTAVAIVFGGLGAVLSGGDGNAASLYIAIGVPIGLLALATVVPLIALQVRRFHDRNLSGWWYLLLVVLGVIPYLGIVFSIAILVISILKGTDGPNKFGPDPLRPEATAEVFA
ncbi:membrane protein [Camelimonas fluminis]|uniref:DUF805 domain-containing protein n=1 Tax=Camelimonas fluminis TaxID=1576911 RepID=A0ABV7UKY3_9HYPH|nr:DUF805 domain-containing protein [Camelimonas fluminis]GHE61162.1 membrane protein [Camelimonas fluminis]